MWNNKFKLIYTVTVKGDGLVTQLTVHNLNGNIVYFRPLSHF